MFRNYVNSNKDDLFEDGAELILDKLDKIAISVGKALEVSMNSLAEKVPFLDPLPRSLSDIFLA